MKKIILLLCLLAFARANTFGQCGSCTSLIPLLDNDFIQWNGKNDAPTWTCTDELGGASPTSVYTTLAFHNTYLPNWYSINGAPGISSYSSSYTHAVLLRTLGVVSSYAIGFHCGSTGSQGIAANYPFLAHGRYQVTLNVIDGENVCATTGNASVNVVATSGLSEPPGGPSYIVEPPVATSTLFPPWLPATSSSISAAPYYFCASTPLPANQNQLYIYVNQGTPEPDDYSPDDVEPRGLSLWISSVDVSLCNQCSQFVYSVNSNSSVDPTSGFPFSSAGLFLDAAIVIDGPYTPGTPFRNNPGLNELLWAKYIEVNRSGTMGNAFLATVNPGTFFEMLPNNSCGNSCSLDPIVGPDSMCIGDVFYTFTNSTSGGTWTSSAPSIVSINPSTGYVGGTPSGTPPGTMVTITYTVHGCFVTKTVKLVNCGQGGRMMQVVNDKAANDTLATNEMLDVYPNPAHSNITISYTGHSSQLLKISIKDVNGGVVHTESVMCNSNNNTQHSVDISSFAPGVYFVELTLGDQHVMKKIIKL